MPLPPDQRPLDFVALGRAAVDLYGEQIGGSLEDMASFAKYLGGCPANTTVTVDTGLIHYSSLTLRASFHQGTARKACRGR